MKKEFVKPEIEVVDLAVESALMGADYPDDPVYGDPNNPNP